MAVNNTNTTALINLAAFTMYVINVSAVSSGGVGPGNTTKARTNDAGINDFLLVNKTSGLNSPIQKHTVIVLIAQSFRLSVYIKCIKLKLT